jgi:general nucleoside transport system permease protein
MAKEEKHMNWDLVLNWGFLVALFTAGVRLAVPILLATLGEVITEKSGVFNLGIEGIMSMGTFTGFAVAFLLENNTGMIAAGEFISWLGVLAGFLAGMVMGMLMAFLCITLKIDQLISGITLSILGLGISEYLYRQIFSSSNIRLQGMSVKPIPILSEIPIVGDLFFNHTALVYLSVLIVIVLSIMVNRTTWGLRIISVGEHPAAAETSGVNVAFVRYAATVFGAGLMGMAGAALVMQLKMFRTGITGGKGFIALALVVFARWKPKLALVGAVLFGVAESLQIRIQALGLKDAIPYEFLLMLPYIFTVLVLIFSKNQYGDQPTALGVPYTRGDN